jgi:copper(I)-binding protein
MKFISVIKNSFAVTLLMTTAMISTFPAGARATDSHQIKMIDHGNMDHTQMMNKQASTPAKAKSIEISKAWVRMSFGRAVNSAGFMSIKNTSSQDDMLIGVSSAISKRTELHTHIRDGQIMRMRRVEGGIKIPKGSTTQLKPGGFHIMFIGLHKALKKGDAFPLTLSFKKAGDVILNITAQKKAMPGGMMMDHSKMKMKMDMSK